MGSVSSVLWTIVWTTGGGASVVVCHGGGPLSIGMADAAAGTASATATVTTAARRRGIMGRTSEERTRRSEDLVGGPGCPFAVRRIVLRAGAPYGRRHGTAVRHRPRGRPALRVRGRGRDRAGAVPNAHRREPSDAPRLRVGQLLRARPHAQAGPGACRVTRPRSARGRRGRPLLAR